VRIGLRFLQLEVVTEQVQQLERFPEFRLPSMRWQLPKAFEKNLRSGRGFPRHGQDSGFDPLNLFLRSHAAEIGRVRRGTRRKMKENSKENSTTRTAHRGSWSRYDTKCQFDKNSLLPSHWDKPLSLPPDPARGNVLRLCCPRRKS